VIVVFGVQAQFNETSRYAHAAFDDAVRLVERSMRESLTNSVSVQVSNSRQMADLVVEAHRPMFGRQSARDWRYHMPRAPFGTTTVTEGGVLIVINAQKCRGRTREIAKTLLHELGHAIQLGRPDAHARYMAGLRNNYGFEELTDDQVADLNAHIDDDETEAARLERLWRKLRRTVA
jgi:hypothetical protein